MTIAVAGLNPAAAYNEQPTNYGLNFIFKATPTLTKTTTPKVGNAVQFAAAITYTPTGDGHYSAGIPLVKKSATSGDHGLIGVCVGGSAPGATPSIGGLVMVRVLGLCQVIVNNTTVVNGSLIQSTTAGVLKYTATAVLGETLGFALEVVTSPATPTKIWAWVGKY